MNLRLALLGLLALAPHLLSAFDVTITGTARERDGWADGATVTVTPDPLWGRSSQAAFEEFKKTKGALPDVKIEGSGQCDAQGAFSVKLTVTTTGEGSLPTRVSRREGKNLEVPYVRAFIRVSKPGRQISKRAIFIDDNERQELGHFDLADAMVLKGVVLRLSDRKPLEGVELVFGMRPPRRPAGRGPTRPPAEPEPAPLQARAKTDASGVFRFEGEDVPPNGELCFADANWAFTPTSAAWTPIRIEGTIDLGNLIAVPGGSLKAKAVNMDTGASLAVTWTLVLTDTETRFQLGGSSEDGIIELAGLPEGTYTLGIRPGQGWGIEVDSVEITGGKVNELGTLKCEPWRSIEIIAVDEKGFGIERYSARVTLVEGEIPYPYRTRSRERIVPGRPARTPQQPPYHRNANLSAERTTMPELFNGKWAVEVTAERYAPGIANFELPAKGPVKVVLELGGTIRAALKFIEEHRGRPSVWNAAAVRQDSPAYPKYKESSLERDSSRFGEPEIGVVRFKNDEQGNLLFGPMASGKYLVVAFTEAAVLKKDDVEVVRGQTTEVTLSPAPSRIEVAVTEGGKPAAGRKVHAWRRDYNTGKPEVLEATSDAKGVALFENLKPGQYRILNDRESKYADSLGKDNYDAIRFMENFGTQFDIKYGTEIKHALELADPAKIWVTIKLSVKNAAMPDWGTLYAAASPPNQGSSARVVDGLLRFLPVPSGKYKFATTISEGHGRQGEHFERELVVNTPPEQEFTLEFEFNGVVITVKTPPGDADLVTHVNLVPLGKRAAARGRPDGQTLAGHRYAQANAEGRVEFGMVADDEYLATARAFDRATNTIQHVASERIVVRGGDVHKTITFSANTGKLIVEVIGNPALGTPGVDMREGSPRNWGGAGGSAKATVTLLDSHGEVVELPDPFAAEDLVVGLRHAVLASLPVGTYGVKIVAHGLLPSTQDDVKIEKGKTTRVRITPLPAGVLEVNVKYPGKPGARAGKVILEDESGNQVAVEMPDKEFVRSFAPDENGNEMKIVVHSLTSAVKQVRITFEGYEDAVIKLKVEPGRTVVADIEPKKKE